MANSDRHLRSDAGENYAQVRQHICIVQLRRVLQHLDRSVRAVDADKFVGRHDRPKPGNSGSWRRDDGPLARESNPHRIKKQERIIAIEPHNKKKQPIENPIPAQIKAHTATPHNNPERMM